MPKNAVDNALAKLVEDEEVGIAWSESAYRIACDIFEVIADSPDAAVQWDTLRVPASVGVKNS